jgi:hypothetical protein
MCEARASRFARAAPVIAHRDSAAPGRMILGLVDATRAGPDDRLVQWSDDSPAQDLPGLVQILGRDGHGVVGAGPGYRGPYDPIPRWTECRPTPAVA